MALVAHEVVPLAGFDYVFERATTPAMQLCRHAATALGRPAVPGKFLAAVEWTVLVCPVRLDDITMHVDDYQLFAAVTRAYSISACQGDRALEARLWKMRQLHGPWTSPAVPRGVLWVDRADDVADELLSA